MPLPTGFAGLPASCRTALAPSALFSLVLLSALPAYAQPQAPLATDPPTDQQPADTTTAVPPAPDTHASRQAPTELITLAAREPGAFIGKTLVLHDGTSSKTVGPVKDVRKRLQDEELYLVVDAAAYFNTPVNYAVAVRDLDRIVGDELIIPEASGMHLNGLDYYAEDYADIEVTAPAATTAPADEDE